MKKVKGTLIAAIGILLFLIAYKFDDSIGLFFKNSRLQFLDPILSIITNFGVVLIAMLFIPSFILYKKNKKSVYLLFMTFFVSFVLAFIIKLIVLRQRPIEIFTHSNISIINYPLISILYYSFPSMHAMVAFSLLPTLMKYLPKLKHFWIVFAFLVSFARIYFGFHFLSDVVFGAIFGYFIGIFLLKKHDKK